MRKHEWTVSGFLIRRSQVRILPGVPSTLGYETSRGCWDYLFATVLDGRNAQVGDGVRRALGREQGDFAEFARRNAAEGVWSVSS